MRCLYPGRTLSHHLCTLMAGLSMIISLGTEVALGQEREADLEDIKTLREAAVEALNTRDFDQIEPFLHRHFTITTVDNQIFNSAEEFEAYWDQQLAGPIERIEMTVEPDGDTIFLSEETGVNYGEANSTFYFSSGNVRDMRMRWSSVVSQDDDIWKLQSLHFSANLLDNPVLRASQQAFRLISAAIALGSLVLGFLASLLIWRRLQGNVSYSSSEQRG